MTSPHEHSINRLARKKGFFSGVDRGLRYSFCGPFHAVTTPELSRVGPGAYKDRPSEGSFRQT